MFLDVVLNVFGHEGIGVEFGQFNQLDELVFAEFLRQPMVEYFVSLVFGIGLITRQELFSMFQKYLFGIHPPGQPFFRESPIDRPAFLE